MYGARARAVRGEMPQPSSRMEEDGVMEAVLYRIEGRESHSAKRAPSFQTTLCVRYVFLVYYS